MTHRLSALVLLLLLGLAAAPTLGAQTAAAPRPIGVVLGAGFGFGTSGVHQDGRGDSKPGEFLNARIGVARNGRPLVIVDLEVQPFGGPIALTTGTTTKTEFKATSFLAGVVLSPIGEFYVTPRLGAQARSWSGPLAASFSEEGLVGGVDVGYHLAFGRGLLIVPEAFYRYAAMDGPDAPSARGLGFRVVAQWVP